MTAQENDMSAQEKWKLHWRMRNDLREPRYWQRRIRREAALERIIARQARRIDELQAQVWQLEAQEHNRDDGNEWEKEYYLRGMHR